MLATLEQESFFEQPEEALKQIEILMQQEFYQSAYELSSLLGAYLKKDQAKQQFRARACSLTGDSLLRLRQPRRAMRYFEHAMNLNREMELNYHVRAQFARCCLETKDFAMGKTSVKGIPIECRGAVVWQILGKLHEACGEFSDAIRAYEEVLNLNPFAAEAYEGIRRLFHAQQALSEETASIPEREFPSLVVQELQKARNFHYEYQYDLAIESLETCLRHAGDCVDVWAELAAVYYRKGDLIKSAKCFERTRQLDSESVRYMDLYAAILRGQSQIIALNKLANELLPLGETPEAYVVLARYCDAKGQKQKAVSFLDHALRIDNHREAHYVKGVLLLSMGKNTDAMGCFKKAHKLLGDVYSYDGILETCIAMHKNRDALHYAKEAARCLSQHPRALTAIGMVLQQSGETDKAKKAFEAALRRDDGCVEAIVALASLYCARKQYKDAINHLEKYLANFSTDWLHTRIGDVYFLAKDPLKAFYHYHFALALNPEYDRAKEGIQRVDKILQGEEDEEMDANDDNEGFEDNSI